MGCSTLVIWQFESNKVILTDMKSDGVMVISTKNNNCCALSSYSTIQIKQSYFDKHKKWLSLTRVMFNKKLTIFEHHKVIKHYY